MTEKEWNSAGTRILFLDRLDQLETEIKELKEYRSRFHEKDKEAAVQREKLRQLETADKLLDFCLGAGGVLIGLGTFLLDKGQMMPGLVTCLAGVVLLVWPLLQKYYPRSV